MEEYLPLSSSHMDYFEPIYMCFQAKNLLKKICALNVSIFREFCIAKYLFRLDEELQK